MTIRERANMIWDDQKKHMQEPCNLETKDRCVRFLQNAIIHHCFNKQQSDFIRELQNEIIKIYDELESSDGFYSDLD